MKTAGYLRIYLIFALALSSGCTNTEENNAVLPGKVSPIEWIYGRNLDAVFNKDENCLYIKLAKDETVFNIRASNYNLSVNYTEYGGNIETGDEIKNGFIFRGDWYIINNNDRTDISCYIDENTDLEDRTLTMYIMAQDTGATIKITQDRSDEAES